MEWENQIMFVPLYLSLGAVFAAFFDRAAAKVCAAVVVGIVALELLVILVVNRWNFAWLLFLLLEASPPMLIIYGSLFLSVVAIGVPLRSPAVVHPDGARTPEKPRWKLFALVVVITLAGIVFALAKVAESRRNEQMTRALLSGDTSIRLRQVQVDNQQRRVICTDPAVLRYLEERFRGQETGHAINGTWYHFSLFFDGGGTQELEASWADSGDFEVDLGDPEDGGTAHVVRLDQPRPQGLEVLIGFLNKPISEVAGAVLILDGDGSRIERDESLVAR